MADIPRPRSACQHYINAKISNSTIKNIITWIGLPATVFLILNGYQRDLTSEIGKLAVAVAKLEATVNIIQKNPKVGAIIRSDGTMLDMPFRVDYMEKHPLYAAKIEQ